MPPKIDFSGRRFPPYKVVEDSGRRYKGQVVWKCICECGKIRHVATYVLTHSPINECKCHLLKDRKD